MKAFAAFGGKYHTLGTLVGLLTSLLWLHQLSVGNVDPDVERNVTEIIADKGYLVQEHTVTTRDGYVLPLQRIPYGQDELRSSSSSPTRRFKPRPPVIVMHALLFSSTVWVVNGPDQSLPYVLADAGFDVWLGNVRGNSQSRHVNYTWYQKEMWDFSLDEIGEFDVADTIDFVLNVTGHNKTFFVGHSLGAATLFGLLSEKPDYNNKILLFSAMAPAIRLHNMTSPIPRILPILNELAAFAALFGRYDFLSHDRMTHFIVTTICRYPVTRAICPWIINVIAGQQTRPINATRMPVFLKDTPAGTSYKNMKHMGQVYTTRRFGKFDYGAQRNIEVYGKATPPEYDFRRVSAPVALFWSQADALVSAEHMATLREKLPNLVLDFRVADDQFSHQEFAIGVTAKEAVYDDLVDIMKRFSGQG